MKKVTILLFVILMLTIVSVVGAQSYPDPGTSVTNAILQNMATGAGDTATVVVNYYNTAGSNVYSNPNVTIAPKAVVEVKTENEPLPAGFEGSAIVSSDKPIASVTSIRNTNVPGAADGTTQGAYNGASAGSETLYFPSFWAFQFIVSRVTVQNTENATANIALDFYNRQGTALGTLTTTLPPYGSRTFCGCNPADWPGGVIPAGFEDGSITVRSTNGVKLAGASVATWANRSGAYQALTDADTGTVLYSPSAFRFSSSGSINSPTLFSAVNIQNTSSTQTANVDIEFYNRDNGNLDLTLQASIPPLSAIGANTLNGGDFPASAFAALEPSPGVFDWDGAIKIISTNGVALAGTGVTNWGTDQKGGMSALASANTAANKLFLPAQYRLDFGSGWAQWSSINLQNVGTDPIDRDDLRIEYIDTNGNTIATFTGTTGTFALPFDLAPGAALGLNTRTGGDTSASAFTSFGLSMIGGIYVSSSDANDAFVATANIIYNNRASVYNAVPSN